MHSQQQTPGNEEIVSKLTDNRPGDDRQQTQTLADVGLGSVVYPSVACSPAGFETASEFPGSVGRSRLKLVLSPVEGPTANAMFRVPFRGLFGDSAGELIPRRWASHTRSQGPRRKGAFTLPLLSLLLVIGSAATATATDHSGTCTGTFPAADNPHRLTGSCTVPTGQTLTLEPGVTLDGQNNTLTVSGTLAAAGTELQPIMFNGVFINFAGGSSGQITNSVVTAPTASLGIAAITITDASPTISGNTLTDPRQSGRLITVGGSSVVTPAAPTISGNQLQVPSPFGTGIVYNTGTAGGTVQGNTITFPLAATGGRTGIQVNGSASPHIEGNTIGDDAGRNDTGIALLVAATSTAQVVNNDICSTGGDTPIEVALGFFANTMLAQVSGTTLSCGLAAGVAVSGTAAVATTLSPVEGQTTLHLASGVTVNSGAQLTIPTGLALDAQGQAITVNGTLTLAPGVILTGQNNALTVSGMLAAAGTALQPIMFNGVFINFAGGSGGQITNNVVTAPTTSFSTAAITITDASPTISGNTLTDPRQSGRLITVGGSSVVTPAAPTISGNQLQVPSPFGIGIVYNTGTAGGTVQGNTLTFPLAATGGRTGIQINGSASPRIEANTIGDDPGSSDTGIALLVSATSTAQVVNNDICSTGGDTPLSFALAFFADTMLAQVTGNTLSCGVAAGFAMSGALTANSTLINVAGQTTYRLTSTVTVGGGARLAIPPGFRVVGQGNTLGVDGTLMATDVVFSDVTFDFRAGSSGSTLADSTITGPSGSFGTSMTITNSSPTISGNDLSGVATGIAVTGGSPSLSGNSFTGLSTAITLNGATNASIDGNTFANNTTAIRINGTSALSTVATNMFDANTSSLVFANFGVLFSAFPQMFETNQFTGAVDQNVIPFPSSVLDVSGTLPSAPVAYRTDTLSIPAGTVVVLSPGTVIRGTSGAAITVNGQLVSAGTPDQPIRFTTTSPKTGLRWGGLTFINQLPLTPSVLDSCIIEFAGSGNVAALRLDNSSIAVSNSRISDNNAVGIELVNGSNATIADSSIVMNLGDGIRANTGSAPTVNQSSIFANGGSGLNKQDCPMASNLIDAQNNFWGDDSGPRDASDDRAGGGLFNLGAGDEVSNCVDFDPWIRLGPSIAGTITGISGGGQTAPVGTCLPDPLVVEIDSTLGAPLQGIDVIFSVVSGDASIVENQPVQTGADGRAQATVCFGSIAGDIAIAVTARDVNSPFATFMPTAEPGNPCLFVMTAQHTEPACPGDCDNDGEVTIAEIVGSVDIVLGSMPMSECSNVDRNKDGAVTIDELVAAVNAALRGCAAVGEGKPG